MRTAHALNETFHRIQFVPGVPISKDVRLADGPLRDVELVLADVVQMVNLNLNTWVRDVPERYPDDDHTTGIMIREI
jgi:hypothetical protein